MSEEEIISDLYSEIQIAKNTLEHNKLYSKDEELISYNEEYLELLLGVRDLIEKQQKEIENLKFANKVLDSCLNDFYKIEDKEIENE